MTLYMPLFRSCTTLRTLGQLHAHLLVTGLHGDPLPSTKLIESYAQMGTLQSSTLVFQTFKNPDAFMWGVLIKCHVWNQLFQAAVSLYQKLISQQTQISSFVFPSVLRACSGFGDLDVGGEVHGRIIKCGFDSDAVVETSLLCMYGELGSLDNARKVFDKMWMRDVVSWSSIISSYVENGEAREGLKMFCRMVSEGVEPDSVTMLSLAEVCAELGCLRLAKSVHGCVVSRGIESDGSLDNSLVVMYGKCDDLCSAERIFENVSLRSTASWTAMISSYNKGGYFHEALEVFVEMLESKVEPNSVTMMGILCSCAKLGCLKGGKSVHCFVIRKSIDPGFEFLGPALIEFYADCGKIRESQKVFETIQDRNVVLLNMLISVHARKGFSKEALAFFLQMRTLGLIPDSFSLASSLSACGNMGFSQLGHQIHGHIIKTVSSSEFVQNSLIDMYSKCGLVDSAYMIFDKIQQKSVITWNSMVCGFSQNGNSVEAVRLFDQMYLKCLEMDEVTFLSVIQACSQLGYLEKGKWVHHKLITYGVRKDLYIDTALTDMYAKCGDLQTAQGVFNSISEKSVVSWSTMIAGYGVHGQINAAISLFTQMVESGIKPNDITFMNILSACSHAGCVEEGKLYLKRMRDFGIEPNSEHLACMVDLLSRAGDLDGAYKIISSMPFPAESSIWSALLNGCRIHRRMDLIKSIQRDLLNMKSDDSGYYTLLSNIYAEGGNWNEFGKVRSVMKRIGLRKAPGYSTIELDKRIHRFEAGDASQLQTREIYSFLENFQSLALEHSYDVGNDSFGSDTCIFPKGNNVKSHKAGNCIWDNQYQSRRNTQPFGKLSCLLGL